MFAFAESVIKCFKLALRAGVKKGGSGSSLDTTSRTTSGKSSPARKNSENAEERRRNFVAELLKDSEENIGKQYVAY